MSLLPKCTCGYSTTCLGGDKCKNNISHPLPEEREPVYRWVKAKERLPQLPNPLPPNTPEEHGILFINRIHSASYFWFPSYGQSAESILANYSDTTLYGGPGWSIRFWEWLEQIPAPIPQPVSKETDPDDTMYCPHCKVPSHRHGTACGWNNATITLDPHGKISTPEHPLNGQHFSTACPIGDPRKAPPIPESLPASVSKESLPTEIPVEIMEMISKNALVNAKLHFSALYSPDQNTACVICYTTGARDIYRHLQASLSSMKAEVEEKQQIINSHYVRFNEFIAAANDARAERDKAQQLLTQSLKERDEALELASDRLATMNLYAERQARAESDAKMWKEQLDNFTKPFHQEGTF